MLAALAALAASAAGFVLDKDQSCAIWAREGECETPHVREICPLSCAVSDVEGTDSDASCAGWRRDGECNQAAVQKLCPVTCGISSPPCRPDDDARCEAFAAAGECFSGNEWISIHCASACRICEERCVDLDDSCPAWVHAGFHISNPAVVLRDCASSASICGNHTEPTVCDDKDPACASWGAPECLRTPDFMYRECAKTCGVCRSICVDKSVHCKAWSRDGECEKNAGLVSSCPASCGICSIIANSLAEKDEL